MAVQSSRADFATQAKSAESPSSLFDQPRLPACASSTPQRRRRGGAESERNRAADWEGGPRSRQLRCALLPAFYPAASSFLPSFRGRAGMPSPVPLARSWGFCLLSGHDGSEDYLGRELWWPGGGRRQTVLIRPGPCYLGLGQALLLWAAPRPSKGPGGLRSGRLASLDAQHPNMETFLWVGDRGGEKPARAYIKPAGLSEAHRPAELGRSGNRS